MKGACLQIQKVRIAFVLILLCAAISVLASGQTAPLVIAWQAPDGVTNCVTGTPPPGQCECGLTPSAGYCFGNFISNVLPYVSGIGMTVHWGAIDYCSAGTTPCSNQSSTCLGPMDYKFCQLDNILLAYINSGSFTNKKIVLIVKAVSDPPTNAETPPYVFSTTWAGSGPPQDVVVCSSYPGDVTSMTCPVQVSSGGFTSADFAIWNVNGLPNNCEPIGHNLSCHSCGTITDFSGIPVVYETPYMTAYQKFLSALGTHYSPNSPTTYGKIIAPYIAYVRVGLAQGGENLPFCAVSGHITQDQWISAPSPVPRGYLVNTGGIEYVATGSGTKGSSVPNCSTPGCLTAPDGKIPGWYNAGPYTQPGTGSSIWPGPTGLFADPQDYSDNGYLSLWKATGDTGYVTSMVTFLKGLNASFPFTIAAVPGPPASAVIAYADSDAIIASAGGIGFGMESVNIGDSQSYAAQTFPTSSTDWAHNFKTYPAPVHPLQTYFPGYNEFFAAGYAISNIKVNSPGVATITCSFDCSPFSFSPIYISGNSNPSFNGIWTACPAGSSLTCPTDTLEFAIPSSASTTEGYNGIVWGPETLPIILPFAVQHGATSIEVYECDLDYALGLGPSQQNLPTTNWVSDESDGGGCAEWGVAGSGPPYYIDTGYVNALSDTQQGQPAFTSVRTGNSTMVKGTQF